MWLLRKMHMKQKTAQIMKASHHCLEVKCSRTEALGAQIIPRGKVNLHTSHLFSDLFNAGQQRLPKGPGGGTAKRSTLSVGTEGTWAAKHHMAKCGKLP